ncbi:MAG TPA: hypothetical protein VGL81_02095 [Polyangiaceae bacterium]|jgi:predicted HTH transcriptional regulator
MPSLKKTLDEIATRFTSEILAALSRANVEELQEALPNGRRQGSKTPRTSGSSRSAVTGHALEQLTATLVRHLKDNGPTRSEDLRKALGVSREDIGKALALATEWKVITKTGEKRATTYKAVKQRGPKPKLTVGDRLRVAAVTGGLV